MEYCPYCEGKRLIAWRWFLKPETDTLLLMNLKVHHRIHRIPSVDPILCQFSPFLLFLFLGILICGCYHYQDSILRNYQAPNFVLDALIYTEFFINLVSFWCMLWYLFVYFDILCLAVFCILCSCTVLSCTSQCLVCVVHLEFIVCTIM